MTAAAWWIIAIFVAIGFLESTMAMHRRLRHLHRRTRSSVMRLSLYVFFVAAVAIIVVVQRTREPGTDTAATRPPETVGTTSAAIAATTFTTTVSETNPGTTQTETAATTATAPPPSEERKSAWERLEHGLIVAAKKRPPDFEEVVGPDEVGSSINVQEHRRRIFAFELDGSAEGYWFWGGAERDMVVAPCKEKDGWQTCTPPTTTERPPNTMRIHNLDRRNKLTVKLWFVPYSDDGANP